MDDYQEQEYNRIASTRNKLEVAYLVCSVTLLILIPTIMSLYYIKFKYVVVFEAMFVICFVLWIIFMVLTRACCFFKHDTSKTTDAWEV